MEVSCQQPPAKEEEAEILGVMTPIYCPSCGENLAKLEGGVLVAKYNKAALFVLGLQHAFTMFGATILVPYLTGVPVTVALFAAGVGTLLFHILTKFKVPVFLGSSFAFIAPINAVILYHANLGSQFSSVPEAISAGFAINPDVIAYATGGILIAGLVQVGLAFLIKKIGMEAIKKLFPPVVSGSIIVNDPWLSLLPVKSLAPSSKTNIQCNAISSWKGKSRRNGFL